MLTQLVACVKMNLNVDKLPLLKQIKKFCDHVMLCLLEGDSLPSEQEFFASASKQIYLFLYVRSFSLQNTEGPPQSDFPGYHVEDYSETWQVERWKNGIIPRIFII